MRTQSTSAVAALALALLCCTRAGHAQVQVDPRALDLLQPATPAQPKPAPKPAARAARPAAPASVDGPHQTLPPAGAAPSGPPPAAAAIPKPAPPPAPVLPPPIAVPVRPAPPPPPPPVVADAPGAYSKLPGGLRVTFGPDRADLNPGTLGALRILAHSGAASPQASFSVTAYAAGSPDDPSTPRRLSLSRALAVRGVLISEGIPSVRIYVKALGAAPGGAGAPPDRADVIMESGPPGTPPQANQKAAQ